MINKTYKVKVTDKRGKRKTLGDFHKHSIEHTGGKSRKSYYDPILRTLSTHP